MGELKSCLFCGKHVDEAFEYCPHCGYEFGEGDDVSTFGGELPGLIGDECGGCVPEEDESYLHRLRTLQEILSDMERELDHILAMEGEVGRGEARRSRAKGGS